MTHPPLLASQLNGVLTLRLNRPEALNAINRVLRTQLRDALQAAALDPVVRVVVIRGDDRAFCAGGDRKEMGNGPADNATKLGLTKQIVQAIADMGKPVVAVVRGHAVGAGLGLAMACDFIVADESASFGAPFVGMGLAPDMGATYWLVRQVGLHRAKDIFMSRRTLDVALAVEFGIVARHWSSTELDDRLDEFTSDLVGTSAVALAMTKRMLNRSLETDLSAALDAEFASQMFAADSPEARAALAHDP
jgi:2-(1,2-epoxy-1,2-dihydrophenyl)acetyl-CoA isomerase